MLTFAAVFVGRCEARPTPDIPTHCGDEPLSQALGIGAACGPSDLRPDARTLRSTAAGQMLYAFCVPITPRRPSRPAANWANDATKNLSGLSVWAGTIATRGI
ncbi:MAG: hypothetical protein ABSE84_01715 [Isosphaeraceae bacterium]